jgi:hypothetical protein
MAIHWGKITELNNTARELEFEFQREATNITMFLGSTPNERWRIESAEKTFSELQKVWEQLEKEYKNAETN